MSEGDVSHASNEARKSRNEFQTSINSGRRTGGIVIEAFGHMHPDTIIDETELARVFDVTTRTIRRMVSRNELPPPVPLAGRSAWIVRRVLHHIDDAAQRAERDARARVKALDSLRLE